MNDELPKNLFLQYSDLARVAGVYANPRRLSVAISAP
jgi:hypothetical protein